MRRILLLMAILLMPVTAPAFEELASSSLPQKSFRFAPPQWICERIGLLVDKGTLPASYKEVFTFPCEVTPDTYGQMLVYAAEHREASKIKVATDVLVLSLYQAYPSAVHVTGMTFSAAPGSWLTETHQSNLCAYLPAEYWAYNAMTYLQQNGYLAGYPPSYFDGHETLTNLQFALAVSEMLNNYQTEKADGTGKRSDGLPEQIKIMFDTLRAEFSDQLGFWSNGGPPQVEQVIEPKPWLCERVALLSDGGVLTKSHRQRFTWPSRCTPLEYAQMLADGTHGEVNNAADPFVAEWMSSLYLEYPGTVQLEHLSFELASIGLSEYERRYCFEQTFWEVEPDHWSYNALDNLQGAGVLLGYQEGYFSRTSPLTRYQLASAVAQAIRQHPDYFNKPPQAENEDGRADQFKIILQTLNAEFSDIMGLFGVELEDVGGFRCFG